MRCAFFIFASVATLFGMLPGFLNAAETKVAKAPYHSWDQALTIGNRKVEAIIVPEIGRVMQFRFVGELDGPFWENPALFGAAPDSHSKDWKNFGGDKTWPAPQADWEKVTGRGWPPPAAFDSVAIDAKIESEKVVLISPIDAHFGIQTEREIRLHPNQAKMTIRTTYFKRRGEPKNAAIWVITQLKDPLKMYMPLPEQSLFPRGYNKQSESLPANLKVEGRILTCTRSPSVSTKIGSDASSLLWGDDRWLVRVSAPRIEGKRYPDNNSSAEIYTNADPLKYIELELLGPLHLLKQGDQISHEITYELFRREGGLDEQVARIIKR